MPGNESKSLGIPPQEVIRKGLVPMPKLQRKLDVLYGGLSVNGGGEFSPEEKPTFPEEVADQYAKEFEEDTNDFRLKLQRLKMRLARSYMAGAYKPLIREDDEDFEDQLLSPIARDVIMSLYWKDKLSSEESRKLADMYGQRVPHDFSFANPDNLNSDDTRHLLEMVQSMRFSTEPSSDDKVTLDHIRSRINRIEQDLQSIASQGELLSDVPSLSEDRLATHRDEYRLLLKDIAAYEERRSWYSPTSGTSGKGQRSDGQEDLIPGLSDYQRWELHTIGDLQNRLHNTLFRRTNKGEHAESLLFNNGQAALTAILLKLEKELAEKGKPAAPELSIVRANDIYFECDELIDNFAEGHKIPIKKVSGRNAEQIISIIKETSPLAVFMAPVANAYTMEVTPLQNIIQTLMEDPKMRDQSRRTTYLVIDDSMHSLLSSWHDLNFELLPSTIKILSFQSLIKYAQDGQELAQAGLVTAIGRFASQKLRPTRGQSGLIPPETTIRRLEAIGPPDVLRSKVERHSRNALFIAKKLQSELGRGRFLSEVIHPSMESHPQKDLADIEVKAGGALANIAPSFDFLHSYSDLKGKKTVSPDEFEQTAKDIVSAYIILTLALAREAGVEMNEGTSYGFNSTRIARYWHDVTIRFGERKREVQMPYVRLAAGTENIKDTFLIAESLKRASHILEQAIAERRLFKFTSALINESEKYGEKSPIRFEEVAS